MLSCEGQEYLFDNYLFSFISQKFETKELSKIKLNIPEM